MKFLLGIDAGGTKTEFAISDEHLRVLNSIKTDSISLRQLSEEEVIKKIENSIDLCLAPCKLQKADIVSCCVGYPCFGESPADDRSIENIFSHILPYSKIKIVNDVEIAWKGAQHKHYGVHLVCGTGSIAFGKNSSGLSTRTGGWIDYFSDEGSGYWLGRKTMQLFSMEADGRAEKSALYDLICDYFNLTNDLQFVDVMLNNYIPYRDKVASMQLLLLQAAKAGDLESILLYQKAAEEAVKLVVATGNKLSIENYYVTYSGGITKVDFFLKPFITCNQKYGNTVVPPKGTPIDGAIKFASEI